MTKKIVTPVFITALMFSASSIADGPVSSLAGEANGLSQDLAAPAVYLAGDTLLLAGGAADGAGGVVVDTVTQTGALAVRNVEGAGMMVNETGDVIAEEGIVGLPIVGTVAATVTGTADDLLAMDVGDTATGLVNEVTGTVDGLTGNGTDSLLGGDLLGDVTGTVDGLAGGIGIGAGAEAGASGSAAGQNASAGGGVSVGGSGGLLGTGLLAN